MGAAQEAINKVLEQVKAQLEVVAEAAIQQKLDAIVDVLLTKLVEAIPGKIDDVVVASVAPKLKEELKVYLLAQAEKISTQV